MTPDRIDVKAMAWRLVQDNCDSDSCWVRRGCTCAVAIEQALRDVVERAAQVAEQVHAEPKGSIKAAAGRQSADAIRALIQEPSTDKETSDA